MFGIPSVFNLDKWDVYFLSIKLLAFRFTSNAVFTKLF